MTDHRLILKLQTPERQAVHERILAAGLSDEQTYTAELLLAMASDGNRMRISTWVALELFEYSNVQGVCSDRTRNSHFCGHLVFVEHVCYCG